MRDALRTLLVTSTIVALFTLAPAPAKQDSATLTYHGTLRDAVAPGRVLTGDGVNDGTFRVDITGTARTITDVLVLLSNGPGGAWVTTGTSWVAGVALTVDGPLLNQANGELPAGVTAGRFYVFIAGGNEGTRFLAGNEFAVTITTTTGNLTTPTLPVPFPPTPLPTTTAPTPDADGDSIPDATDKCPGTAAGLVVETTGQWVGCVPDTTGPAIEMLYPKAGIPTNGHITIAGRSKDPSGVAGMILFLKAWPGSTPTEAGPDGIKLDSWLSPGPDGTFWLPWETRITPGGNYTVRVEAIDMRGNKTSAPDFTFTVNNTAATGGGTGTPGAPGQPGPAGPEGPTAKGSIVILPAGVAPPTGYTKIAELGTLGIVYSKN